MSYPHFSNDCHEHHPEVFDRPANPPYDKWVPVRVACGPEEGYDVLVPALDLADFAEMINEVPDMWAGEA